MAQVGTGISIQFQSGFLAEILNVSDQGMERASIDASHMGSAQMEFLPGQLPNWGQLECEIAFDPDLKPPIDATDGIEVVTITYPNGTTWARSGFMTGFQYQAPLEERMTATASIKFTGDLTVTTTP